MSLFHKDSFFVNWFDNPQNVKALCLDLGLVPAELCPPSVLRFWRDEFYSKHRSFNDSTKDYLTDLSERYQYVNHHRSAYPFGDDLLDPFMEQSLF